MTVDRFVSRILGEISTENISANDEIISLGHGTKCDGISTKQYHLLVIKSSEEREKHIEIMEE